MLIQLEALGFVEALPHKGDEINRGRESTSSSSNSSSRGSMLSANHTTTNNNNNNGVCGEIDDDDGTMIDERAEINGWEGKKQMGGRGPANAKNAKNAKNADYAGFSRVRRGGQSPRAAQAAVNLHSPSASSRALSRSSSGGLIDEGEGEDEYEERWRFNHDIILSTVYGLLLDKDKRDLHRRIASCLEKRYVSFVRSNVSR